MNRLLISAVLGGIGLAAVGAPVWACDRRCQPCGRGYYVRNAPAIVRGSTPADEPAPADVPGVAANDGNDSDDSVVWDLPAESKVPGAKRPGRPGLVRQSAAAPRPAPPTTPLQRRVPEGPAKDVPAAPDGQVLSFHDRMVRAVAAQQVLAAENARLAARAAEIQRWDEAAQEKFRRAFGTTDDRARQLVLQRISQRHERNLRLMAEITDAMNFEFYMQSKRPR